MAKRKPASGGQSQGTPKQVAGGGGAPRTSNPQAANRPANKGHPQKTGNAPAKPPTSSGTGAAPRPPQNAQNGTRSQGPGNGAHKSQGTNGQPSNFSTRVEAKPGPRAMNEGAPKRNGNGPNNHHQKAQGHGPQPNGFSKQQAPKSPKHSQPLVGGHSPAPKPALQSPAPPRPPHPGNVQHVHVPRAKQGGNTHPHVQKTQNHVPAPLKASQTNKSGKNTAKNIFPKVQVAEMHAQHSSRRRKSSASSAKGPQAGNPSHKSQQQHRGHKNTPPKPPSNDRRQGQPPTSKPPKILSSFLSSGSNDTGNRSYNFASTPESTRNSSSVGSGPPHSQTAKKQRPKVKKGTANVLQAAAASLGWEQIFSPLSSWSFPLAPSVDKRTQATSVLTSSSKKAKDAGPKPQAPKSRKGKQLNGNLNTSTSPKKEHKPQAVQHSSTVKPNKSTVPHRKRFPVRLGTSKVLFQHSKRTTGLRKGSLRQRCPTLIWRQGDTPRTVSAYSTLTAAPVPSPPRNELENKVVRRTISEHPDLFKIVSPIKVGVFKKYLRDHPNKRFVKSVVRALMNGFWPWANTSNPRFPTTYDGSGQRSHVTNKDKAKFIKQQFQDEMNLGRLSKSFGKKLLPGMHSSPVGAVPKSTPGKFRLIVDQSRGPHSLNSTIPRSRVKVKLDSIHDLGNKLLAVRKKYPKRKICLWKSDVKSAYRQMPVHPLWQIKQAIPVNGQYHIDRCNTFGNRGGGWIWDSFISLVNWIGTKKKGVSDLLGYVDDNFGWEFEGKKEYYKPYKKHMPTKQVRLLRLWDELGIPHDKDKQLSGPSLRILGYDVDANKMTVKVPDEKKDKVVQLLRSHAKEGKPYSINELQSAAGSVSSALSLYPRLRPGLRVLFDEMAEQKPGTTKLKVTKSVARSLSGLASYLENAPPIRIQRQEKNVRRTKD